MAGRRAKLRVRRALAVLTPHDADLPLLSVEALTLLGQIAWAVGDRGSAQDWYRRAIATLTGLGADREAAQTWFEIGTLSAQAGLVAESADAFRRAAASTGLRARLPVINTPTVSSPRTTPVYAPAAGSPSSTPRPRPRRAPRPLRGPPAGSPSSTPRPRPRRAPRPLRGPAADLTAAEVTRQPSLTRDRCGIIDVPEQRPSRGGEPCRATDPTSAPSSRTTPPSSTRRSAQKGGVAASDYRIAEDGELRKAFDLLVEMGLVIFDSEQDGWAPEDPTSVQSRVVSPLSQEAAKLLSESSQWSSAFSNLSQTWRRAPQSSARGPFTYLRGVGSSTAFLDQIVAECEEELLTAQPQAGRDPRFLAMAALRDIEMLERGVTMRTLYQHSARRSSVTHKYVAAVTARGAEVRTLDEFFNRMIVIDRRVAVIPNQEDLSVAVVIREPAVVAYLVDIFERSWERARAVHQPGDLADEGHRRRAARDDDADAHRGAQRPGQRQAARRQPAHLRRLRRRPQDRVRRARRASSSATRWAGWASPATRRSRTSRRSEAGLTPPAPSGGPPWTFRAAPGEMSRGQRPCGHCPRAVETGLGGRRWDRTSGGKVGSSSQILEVLLSAPAGVAAHRTTT